MLLQGASIDALVMRLSTVLEQKRDLKQVGHICAVVQLGVPRGKTVLAAHWLGLKYLGATLMHSAWRRRGLRRFGRLHVAPVLLHTKNFVPDTSCPP